MGDGYYILVVDDEQSSAFNLCDWLTTPPRRTYILNTCMKTSWLFGEILLHVGVS